MPDAATVPTPHPIPLLGKVAFAIVVAVVLLGAVVLIVGQLLPGGEEAKIAMAVGFMVVAGLILGKVVKIRRPALRAASRAGVLIAAFGILGWWALSLRGNDVQERLVSAPVASAPAPAASTPSPQAAPAPKPVPTGPVLLTTGAFTSLEHDTSGTAEVVRGADGALVLQLRNFATSPGPDVRVYLASDTEASASVDLGGLKGNTGNQRYPIPAGTNTKRLGTVLIWCRSFSVGFGAAKLRAA